MDTQAIAARLTAERDEAEARAVDATFRMKQAEQQRDAAQRDNQTLVLRLMTAKAQCDALKEQRDAAHAALTKYGRHHDRCERQGRPGLSTGSVCTCGLDAALAASAPQKLTCRRCGQVAADHCDLDEPGVDHQIGCDKMHHQFTPAPAQETERGR